MPITQQRMIDLISAAEHCLQAHTDLGAQIAAALDLRAQRITTEAEMINQLTALAIATAPPVEAVVRIAVERQHFKDWAKRNDYIANRRAAIRQGLRAAQQTDLKTPKRQRVNRPGMLKTWDPEQLAKAQKPALPIDPSQALFNIGAEAVGPPTPEQLAADDLLAKVDEDEFAEYQANLRKGDGGQ